MRDFEPLAPACMKCERVTGKSTCFPGPCVFFHERSTPGTKAHNIATLDRIRRGSREPVYASGIDARSGETGTGSIGKADESPVGDSRGAQTQPHVPPHTTETLP